MEQNPTITSLQQATQKAAEAAVSEKEAAEAKAKKNGSNDAPPNNEGVDDPPPPPKKDAKTVVKKDAQTQNPPPAFDLKAYIKEKYSVDLDEEEINKRLSSTNGKEPPAHRETRSKPKPEDITDDQVTKFFTDNKKPDIVKQHSDNQKKDDIELIREHQTGLLKAQFKDMKDDEVTDLINDRYFMWTGNKDDNPYTPEDQKLGEFLLKQDAERLRNSLGFQIDGVRNMLYGQALADYNNYVYQDTIDSFLKTAPEQIILPFGKSGALELGDYPVQLREDVLKDVGEIMREPQKLLNKFKDKPEDANFDLQKMFHFLIKAVMFDSVTKSTASDYYSKGVEFMENKLQNNPALAGGKSGKDTKTSTKKDEEKQAEDFNKKQIAENVGRGRNVSR